MKYLKKKEKSKVMPVVIAICVVLVIVIAVVIALGGRNSGKENSVPETNASVVETSNNEAAVEVVLAVETGGTIETPYGTIYYPAEWEEELILRVTEENPYTVSFLTKPENKEELRLFDIHFDSDTGDFLGALLAEDGSQIAVSMTFYPFEPDDSWSPEEVEKVEGMQEAVNYLIQKLPVTESSGNTKVEDVVIETPYGDLLFPGKWKDRLRVEYIEGEEYIVEFYGKAAGNIEMHLFSVCFGKNLENGIGTIKTADGIEVNVGISFVELAFYGEWSESEKTEICEMQEAVNYLVENLPIA